MIRYVKLLVLISLSLFLSKHGSACSMYKITWHGKTMVGSNYDANYLTCRIWFETAKNNKTYGAFFVGGRAEEENGVLPQSGMNDAGLSFSRLAVMTPEGKLQETASHKRISNHVQYFTDILHTCKTLDDIRNYIQQNGYGFFNNEVCMFIEKSGRYLIVEPDTISSGTDEKYVLANFCPSSTDLSGIRQARYLKGVAFLKNKVDTSVAFCTALSDTMHVCREKIGDGTLLTFIRDLDKGMIYLNFYHDYQRQVAFNLQDELAKGDHAMPVPSLFPGNKEYQKLVDFKTPQNNASINLLMVFCVLLFSCSGLYFLLGFVRKRKTGPYAYIHLVLFVMDLILLSYVLILVRNENIFYFPAPYRDYEFSVLNVAAYIPFLLLALIVPLMRMNLVLARKHAWHIVSISLFAIHNIIFTVLIGFFAYWGLYNVLG
jgi:hypothetical protein